MEQMSETRGYHACDYGRLLFRLYACGVVLLLSWKFGGFIGNGEQANFPLNIWEWVFGSCGPSLFGPVFGGISLLLAVVTHRVPTVNRCMLVPLLWLLPVLAGLIGLWNSTELDYAEQWLYHFAGAFALCASVWWSMQDDERLLPWISSTLALTGIYFCLQGWHQHCGGFAADRAYIMSQVSAGKLQITGQMAAKLSQTRIYGSFFDPNVYSAHLLFCLPFTLEFLWRAGRRFNRPLVGSVIFTLLGIVLYGCALFWAGSRGAALGAAAGITIALWCHPRLRRWRWRWCLPAAGLLVAAALLAIVSLGDSRGGTSTASARITYYAAALKMYGMHPASGVGLGEFHPWYLRLKPLGAEVTRDPHNMLLSLLCQCGTAGGLAGLAILLFPWVTATFGKPSEKRPALFTAACAGMAAWTVHSLLQFIDIVPGTLYPACLGGLFTLNGVGHRLPSWVWRTAGVLLAIPALCAVLRIPGEIEFQKAMKAEGEFRGSGIRQLEETAARLPHSPAPVLELSTLYASTGLWDEATRAAEEYARRCPHRSTAHLRLAMALLGEGRCDESLAAVERALEWYPWSADALLTKGVLTAGAGGDGAVLARALLGCQCWVHSDDDGILVNYSSAAQSVIEGVVGEVRMELPDGRMCRFEATR